MYDVLNNIALDSMIVNKNNSDDNNLIAYDERTLAMNHLQCCNEKDLTIMGYMIYTPVIEYPPL